MLETVKTRLHQAREWLLDYAYLVTLGAMIAVYSWCSPSRVNVTFGVKPGSAAVDAIVEQYLTHACRIWARAERISRPETTMPRSPREAVHWPGSVVTGVIVPL